MPTVLRDGPYRFEFFGIDRSEPPHVHVQRERFQAKYWIDPAIGLAKNAGFRPHELTRIERIIGEHHQELLERWHEFFGR